MKKPSKPTQSTEGITFLSEEALEQVTGGVQGQSEDGIYVNTYSGHKNVLQAWTREGDSSTLLEQDVNVKGDPVGAMVRRNLASQHDRGHVPGEVQDWAKSQGIKA